METDEEKWRYEQETFEREFGFRPKNYAEKAIFLATGERPTEAVLMAVRDFEAMGGSVHHFIEAYLRKGITQQ